MFLLRSSLNSPNVARNVTSSYIGVRCWSAVVRGIPYLLIGKIGVTPTPKNPILFPKAFVGQYDRFAGARVGDIRKCFVDLRSEWGFKTKPQSGTCRGRTNNVVKISVLLTAICPPKHSNV